MPNIRIVLFLRTSRSAELSERQSRQGARAARKKCPAPADASAPIKRHATGAESTMMPEPQRGQQLHDEHRRKVWEDLKSGSENFDKYMVTLSSGALGISLTFIKDIVPLKQAVFVPALIVSWVSFVACILTTLISFRLSIRSLEKMMPYLDAYYLKGETEAFNQHLKSLSTRAVDWCANIGIGLFISGLILTMLFVSKNVFKETSQMSDPIDKVTACDFGKGVKPVGMTPVTAESAAPTNSIRGRAMDGVSPVAMTPVVSSEDRGVKPVPMTPGQPTQPQPATPQSKK